MLTALTPAPARRTHHPLDQHGQQTARQHPVHLRERLPRRHGHPRLPAQGGTAASPGTAHLPCPPRPAPHAAAGQPRPRPADRRFLGQEVPPGSIHLRMQSGLLLETTFGEDKTTITGAGNRTSGPVLRSGSPRLVIQEAWATQSAPRKPPRNFGTPPRPSRPLPGNRRSSYSRPASPESRPQPEPARKEEAAPTAGAPDRGTARHPRRDTRDKTMAALR